MSDAASSKVHEQQSYETRSVGHGPFYGQYMLLHDGPDWTGKHGVWIELQEPFPSAESALAAADIRACSLIDRDAYLRAVEAVSACTAMAAQTVMAGGSVYDAAVSSLLAAVARRDAIKVRMVSVPSRL